MNELHLFAGAGGGILGGQLLGHSTVCAVEIEPYCRQVLLQRQRDNILPRFPIWDDICTFDGTPWRGLVDIVCGGFPCQPFSSASHGASVAKNYWPEMLRIIGQIRPFEVFAENVDEKPILLAQEDLSEIGYKAIRCKLSAKDLGADHIRDRWWLLAHSDNDGELLSSEYAKTRMLPKLCNSVWEAYADEPRVDDGVAHRMDRLKAIGNGQVPIVAATAYRFLKQALDNQ